MTITCFACGGSCIGEVLKVQERHFHINCFKCKVCGRQLASGGYFMKKDSYYCSKDYHVLFGTKCRTCGDYVEGRVVTALGHSYHPQCFACDRCKDEIHSGTVVTYNDRQEILCQKCTDIALSDAGEGGGEQELRHTKSADRGERYVHVHNEDEFSKSGSYPTPSLVRDTQDPDHDLFDFSKVPDVDPVTRSRMGKCSGCGESIRSCQSLIALERHWHLFCFTCHRCNKLLTSEYMSKGEFPYCESCYHELHGVPCDTCQHYITGKVLEAGEKHFHPHCASCCKCNLSFGEGEDMCIAGEDIWHLDCDRVKAALGIKTDSESSSEGSRSQSRTPDSTFRSRRSSSKLQMSRESSAGEPRGDPAIYSLKELQLISNTRLPRDVNRTKLEQHLSDEDFHKVFKMERNVFYSLQQWKQIDLKKRANLF